jgi:DNA-binding transcriptional LysR family regulator
MTDVKRDEIGDLLIFAAVARAGNFTSAARELQTSQSAVSTTVRRLEERLGTRLLTRTTRYVTTTEAGEQLARILQPALHEIETGMMAIAETNERPSGTIRLTSTSHAARGILLPAARQIMAEHPAVHIEISVDQRLVDIVRERFDAGVRLGESIGQDMVALRIGPDLRMAVVGSPAYFAMHGRPQTPDELTRHNCINLRLSTHGDLYVWEFEKGDRAIKVRVDGQFTCNDVEMVIEAAEHDVGLICLPEDQLEPALRVGRLERVLTGFCPPFPGYHLYYPTRRLHSVAFQLLIDRLRYRP